MDILLITRNPKAPQQDIPDPIQTRLFHQIYLPAVERAQQPEHIMPIFGLIHSFICLQYFGVLLFSKFEHTMNMMKMCGFDTLLCNCKPRNHRAYN